MVEVVTDQLPRLASTNHISCQSLCQSVERFKRELGRAREPWPFLAYANRCASGTNKFIFKFNFTLSARMCRSWPHKCKVGFVLCLKLGPLGRSFRGKCQRWSQESSDVVTKEYKKEKMFWSEEWNKIGWHLSSVNWNGLQSKAFWAGCFILLLCSQLCIPSF